MKHPTFLGTVTLLLAACAGAAPTSSDQQRLDEARRLLAAADPDGALLITDELLKEHPDWAQARRCAADGYLQLGRSGRRGLDRGLVLQDAANAYQRAAELDDQDAAAWLGLAAARYELGEYDAARAAAAASIERQAARNATVRDMAPGQLLAARCELELLKARRKDERKAAKPGDDVVRPEKGTLELATMALTRLDQVERALPAEGYVVAAQVYEELDQADAAAAELERGIRTAPDVPALHLAYQDLLVRRQQQRALAGAYARFLREIPGRPVLLFYAGRAEVLAGDSQRGKSAFQPAVDAYRKAGEAFAQYQAMAPADAATGGEWLAICELSLAGTACAMGDLDAAREHLFAAAAASPRATGYDGEQPALRDSFGGHFTGVVFAISRALSESSREPLRRTLAFNEEIVARFPDRWGFVYNNAALAARDLGVQLARDLDGKRDAERQSALQQAMELWERSYRYYQQAVALSPDDARILNDCGLMLVYHLNRDFDHARELFDRAIAAGQRKLDELPADAPRDERNALEEAVGDAYQNIAVLLAKHQQRPFAEAKPFCERAITYYPYRQREAARMLENEGRPRAAAAAAAGPQGTPAEQLAKARAAAAGKADAGDLDGALQVLDGVAGALKDYAPFQALRGEYDLRYARAARAAGRKGVEFLFDDAVHALARAVELDSGPVAPRLLLAAAQFDKGDLDAARATADAALLHMQSLGGGEAGDLATAHRLRAETAARIYSDKKGRGEDDAAALRDARTSFRHLEDRQLLDEALRKEWAAMETWAGAGAEAVGVYARALRRQPDDQTLLAAVVDTAIGCGQAKEAVAALGRREDATGLFYLGRAHFAAAADLRGGGDNAGALAEIDRAMACFAKSMQAKADYADSCEQWRALCLGAKGNVAYWMDRLDDAEKWLLESVRLRPDRINDELPLKETTKLGILRLADKYYQKKDLARVEAIYRAASDAANADKDLLNNAGLFARDHGNQLERAGKQAEAKAMYEQSYKAYSRAQELDPTDVRLCNDRALIAVWHLERDWDLSKQLLEKGIELGDQQLAAFPSGEPQERQNLDEAIGDCWENLALWHLKHDKDAAAAKAAAAKSMRHYPFDKRPGAQRHLQAAERLLQGK